MGLIQAAAGSIGGSLADQWKDFYTVPEGLPPTAALFAAAPRGTNAGRGSNTRGSSHIITNGSRIVVPEGYGLLLMQDGAITALVAQAGAYEWRSTDLQSIMMHKSLLISTTYVSSKFCYLFCNLTQGRHRVYPNKFPLAKSVCWGHK